VVVAGATATGKSALAMELAEALGDLEIVAADSRQVYRGMDIGTAKATPAERARVPHHGLDLVDPDEPFSVADYRRHALQALAGIAERGRAALLVGGTGLYLRAVADGLALEEVAPDPALRAELEERLGRAGPEALAAELRQLAPRLAASTDLANPRRVIRAIERARRLGDRLPPPPEGYGGPSLWLGLSLEPEELRRRIRARAERQFSAQGGFLEEAADLRGGYDPRLPAFSAVGYREAFACLAGELDRAGAVEATIARTWAYARRQRTWFRAEPRIEWLPADAVTAELVRVARGRIERLLSAGASRSPARRRPR
jgi:tRNA dimethylallyltransferase